MKVLQLNKSYPPHVGGIEKVVQQLAEGMVGRDVDVRVLVCHDPVRLWSSAETMAAVPVERANSLGVLFSTPLSPAYLFRYRRALPWADVVHFHVPFPLGDIAQLLAPPLPHQKVVVTFHADPSMTRWGFLSPLYHPLLRQLLRRADCIVTTAPNNIAAFEVLAPYREKCMVIPLAADLVYWRDVEAAEKERIRARHGLGSRKVVLFVGRLSYYKGLTYLIEAIQGVDADLVVVGRGELDRELKRQVEALGLQDRVHFVGFVPDEELPVYYAVADVFALPSITPSEAFGIVQVEAMAHGLPVVNTLLPTGVPFVSLHDETGLTVAPRDAAALGDALRRLVQDEALHRRLAANARKRVALFHVTSMVDAYLQLYEGLLAGRPVEAFAAV